MVLQLIYTLAVPACSNWLMNNSYHVSGRTMDLGPITGLGWALQSTPRGKNLAPLGCAAKLGYVAFVPTILSVADAAMASGGLNEAGLSCDEQTLITTQMPRATNTSADLNVINFCEWALSQHTTTGGVRESLLNGSVHVWGGPSSDGSNGLHHSLRDAAGQSLVIEYVGGKMQVFTDANDGKTGFGIMTNEPEYPWMVRNVQHFEWKRHLARPAVTMPGTWYPDERFLRIHAVKSSMPQPKSRREAIVQVVWSRWYQ
jgi:penicillin V acylase-like amidase (Ntn superfamily)